VQNATEPARTVAQPVLTAAALPKPEADAEVCELCNKCPECKKSDPPVAAAAIVPEIKTARKISLRGGDDPVVSPWLEETDRIALPEHLSFADHDGRPVAATDLRGRPVAMAFVYTRCINPRKCPLVTSTMAELQREIKSAGLATDVALSIVTYDPAYDTPLTLLSYGKKFGIDLGRDFMMLQPTVETKGRLFDALSLAVNYDSRGEVNVHGIQLVLLDRNFRFVRSYHSVLWENASVVQDLQRLVAEPGCVVND
jgi:cytochrome oxidase Cu insertion factor (SCO1/SenC/PrrC family)